MIIKLGLNGQEQDLLQDSLVLRGVDLENTSSITRSANKTLHVDYLPVKRSFELSYSVITKENYDNLLAIYNLQVSNLQNLNYIIQEASGVKTYQVQMEPVSKGADLRDKDFYYDVSVRLSEV